MKRSLDPIEFKKRKRQANESFGGRPDPVEECLLGINKEQ